MKRDPHPPVLLKSAPRQALRRSARIARGLRQFPLAPCQSEHLQLQQQQRSLARHIDALCDCV